MSTAAATPIELDRPPASRHGLRAAAHILGLGLVTAVLVALPAAPSDLDRHQLPKETAVHLATWLAVILARPVLPRGLRPGVLWAIALLIVASVLSAIGATDGWLAARAVALTVTGAAAFITARHLAAFGLADLLLGWCGAAAVIGAATGLAQAYGLNSVLFATTRSPGGTFGNRNFLAHFAALALPLTISTALFALRRNVAVLAASGAALLAAAIVLSRSRDAWIGALVAIGVLGVVLWGLRRQGKVVVARDRQWLAAAGILFGIVLAIAVPNRLAWRSASPYSDTFVTLTNSQQGSGHGRILQYKNSLRLAARHPLLGVGPANWPIRYGDVAPPNDPSWVFSDPIPLNPWPSSDWIALVSERGVLGLLGVILLGLGIAWRAVLGIRAGGQRACAGAALLALLATLGVEGAFDAVLLLPVPLLLSALASGALLEGVDGAGMTDAVAGAIRPPWALVVPLLLGLLTLRSGLETFAYVVAGNGHSTPRLIWAGRIDPTSYAIQISLADRLPCPAARDHGLAALHMAPNWPSAKAAARRCAPEL